LVREVRMASENSAMEEGADWTELAAKADGIDLPPLKNWVDLKALASECLRSDPEMWIEVAKGAAKEVCKEVDAPSRRAEILARGGKVFDREDEDCGPAVGMALLASERDGVVLSASGTLFSVTDSNH